MRESRPGRARTQSLCGTARKLAHRKAKRAQTGASRQPCRHAALWSCQRTVECSRRMESQRR